MGCSQWITFPFRRKQFLAQMGIQDANQGPGTLDDYEFVLQDMELGQILYTTSMNGDKRGILRRHYQPLARSVANIAYLVHIRCQSYSQWLCLQCLQKPGLVARSSSSET
jgi:hypothetical protein